MKIFCHHCGERTNHKVLKKQEVKAHPDHPYHWGVNHYFGKCGGCDSINYAIEEWSEDDWNPYSGEIEGKWTTYPKNEIERQLIDDEHELPGKIRTIYGEIIGAMNARLPVLAGIGLRALIEAICKDRGIKGRTLSALIDGLATGGVLSKAQADILHTHRFLGNAAAHEVTAAKPKELVAAIEIAENILRTIYILPMLSAQIKTGKKS